MRFFNRVQWLYVGAVTLFTPLAMDASLALRIFSIPKLITMHSVTALGLGALLLPSSAQFFQRVLQRPKFPRYFLWFVAAYLSWLGLTTLTAQEPARSWLGSYQWSLGLFTQLGLWALAWLTFLTISNEQISQWLYRIAILGSIPVIAYGLIQYLGLDWVRWILPAKGVAFSTLGNPNFLGGYLSIIIPLTLNACLESKRRLHRLAWSVLLIAQLGCLWETYCKSAMIAVAVSSALLLWQHWRFDWRVFFMVASTLVVASLIVSAALGIYGEGLGMVYLSVNPTQNRLFAWATAYNAVAARPLLGWGLSSFDLILPAYATPGLIYQQAVYELNWLTFDRAHNLWWELAVETGLPGVILWLTLFGALLYMMLRSTESQPLLRGRLVAAVAALISYSLHQLFNPSDIGSVTIFWWLVGWTLGTAFLPNDSETVIVQPFIQPDGAILLSQIFFLVTVFGTGYGLWQWALMK